MEEISYTWPKKVHCCRSAFLPSTWSTGNTDNVRITSHRDVFTKQLLPWKSNKYKVVQIWPGQTMTCLHTISPGHIWTTLYYILLCVCVCACGCGCMGRTCFCACNLTYAACNPHAPCWMRPFWLHHIFQYHLINGKIFCKKSYGT
jgi:hypothetical protein